MIPCVAISVSALPKTGKNHFAYSAPDPIKVYCFNGGASFVAAKFKDKKIDVHNFVLPIVESTEDKWALPIWEEFYTEFKKDIEEGKFKSYIFDTGTEIENFCQQAVLEELQETAEERNKTKKKMAPNEYLSRNLRMNALFATARNSGVHLITLQYLKDEWVTEKGSERANQTGRKVMDGWKYTEAQCDINLELSKKLVQEKGQKVIHVTATILSNRFDDFAHTVTGETLTDPTFDDVIALAIGE